MSELTRRILFAVVAAPLGILIVYVGGAALATLLGVISGLAAWELYRMARANGVEPLAPLGIAVAALIPVAVHASFLGVYKLSITAGVVFFLLVFASTIWLRGPANKPLATIAITIFGALFPATAAYVYVIRYHDYAIGAGAGTALVALPLLLTWGTDTGAYAIGRMFGKKKLIPSVSPGKTVAGAFGGLAFGLLVSVIYTRFILPPAAQLTLTLQAAILFGLVISFTAQIGDLVASLLKRDAGVKDSSNILPGHGGIVDRFDSLFFVLPVSYFLLNQLLIPAPR